MPKVSVYLPEELYQRAREADLAVSTLAQEAIATALRTRSVDAWVEQISRRPDRFAGTIDAAGLMDEVARGLRRMIVLDACALVDAVLDQSTKPWVVERLRGETIIAPAHQPAEVLSAISRLVRAGELRRCCP